MFALVDCNNFYASCERMFNPSLNGKPVVVLSNNDGCVIARSNEAKALGVGMAVPAFQIQHLVERNQIAVFSANFPLYGDMSQRVMSILSGYSPEQEIYSIDECFLNLDGIQEDFTDYGLRMRSHVLKWTGIPVSVGIAPTKTLAKVANHIAKKFHDRTGGSYAIDSELRRIKALKWLKVDDVWGIGRRQAIKLKAIGVQTAYEFSLLDKEWVRRHMTINGVKLLEELNGLKAHELELKEKRQSIAITRTFEKEYTKQEEISERITTFAVTAAEKLRRQKSFCRSLIVFISTNRFGDACEQYSNSLHVKLPFPTSSSIELSKAATSALDRIFKNDFRYKRAGVILMDFINETELQPSLFFNSDPRHKSLMQTIDKLNNKFGNPVLKLAAQEFRTWKMKQEHLSPRYTTNINEVIRVKLI